MLNRIFTSKNPDCPSPRQPGPALFGAPHQLLECDSQQFLSAQPLKRSNRISMLRFGTRQQFLEFRLFAEWIEPRVPSHRGITVVSTIDDTLKNL